MHAAFVNIKMSVNVIIESLLGKAIVKNCAKNLMQSLQNFTGICIKDKSFCELFVINYHCVLVLFDIKIILK